MTVTVGSSYPFWGNILIYRHNGLSKPYKPFVKDSEPDIGFWSSLVRIEIYVERAKHVNVRYWTTQKSTLNSWMFFHNCLPDSRNSKLYKGVEIGFENHNRVRLKICWSSGIICGHVYLCGRLVFKVLLSTLILTCLWTRIKTDIVIDEETSANESPQISTLMVELLVVKREVSFTLLLLDYYSYWSVW